MQEATEGLVKVSREFAAPVEAVWEAWTNPEMFRRWYGPKGFSVPTCEIDLKVGGRHLWSMASPDGSQMYFTGIYKEIVSKKRLVFTDTMSDAQGNPISLGDSGPQTIEVLVTFVHADGVTKVTLSHGGPEQAKLGWEQAFDKLAAVVSAN